MRSHRQHSGSHHDARRRGWPWCVLVAGVLVITTPVGSARADPQDPPDPSATSSDHAAIPLPAARSFAPAGTTSQVTTPYAVTLEPSTDTIYVAGRSDPSRPSIASARCVSRKTQRPSSALSGISIWPRGPTGAR